jgi:Holliday junction resolvase-like predicted endonuclease
MTDDMTGTPGEASGRNYYNELFDRLSVRSSTPLAVESVAEAYLDGKPQLLRKKRTTRKERDKLFWSSRPVVECAPESWNSEVMVLALARYLGQEPVAAAGLVSRVAKVASAALVRAIRYSGLVLNQHSPRRTEVDEAAVGQAEVLELCRVLTIFDLAYRHRLATLHMQKALLADLSAFDLLVFASLYAFERLVPRDFETRTLSPATSADSQVAWDAINDLLVWKLEGAVASDLKLSDDDIGRSVVAHLRPILFEDDHGLADTAFGRLRAFHELVAAQIELNEFVERSANAFSYDDSIKFVRQGDRLQIVEVDPAARTAWQRDGRKLERLHGYWLHRAMDSFVASVAADPGRWAIGRPENGDANRLAWLRALQAQLRLREVYGVADAVATDGGEQVDLFQALLALNLMSMFFQADFLAAFATRLEATAGWIGALQRLAFDGLREGLQNRLPLTWSGRDAKVANITGWTVTAAAPQGDASMASAILDFWTYDLVAISAQIKGAAPGLRPHFYERAVLKFGSTLVQLPWIVGLQNNSTAAINNLRRLGARRGQAREETQRIEAELARLLETRGFTTLLNWKPPRDEDDPGEVDVIATLGQHLFVLEVKSTFLRRSQEEAWLHAISTLRKAGRQLQRKLAAVSQAIGSDLEFRTLLGLTEPPPPHQRHGWIVDTCIECDHQRFAGFLKVSIEEVLIALRDDRHLLNDPEGVLSGTYDAGRSANNGARPSFRSLYPEGFFVERFIEVIETEAVWQDTAAGTPE